MFSLIPKSIHTTEHEDAASIYQALHWWQQPSLAGLSWHFIGTIKDPAAE